MFLSIPTSYELYIYILGARHKEEGKERIEMDADDIPG